MGSSLMGGAGGCVCLSKSAHDLAFCEFVSVVCFSGVGLAV